MSEFSSPFSFRDDVGEAPCWDPDTSTLWRVDVHAGLVHGVAVESGIQTTHAVGNDVAFALPATTGELVVGHGLDIKVLGSDGSSRTIGRVEGRTNTRFNDGKTDPLGRVTGSTMLLDLQNDISLLEDDGGRQIESPAALFQVDGAGHAKTLATGLTLGNGLDWDLERRRFYFGDSISRCIYVCDFDPETGEYGKPREFACVAQEDGVVDGLTVDAEGGVWVALFFGGELRRFASDGSVSERISTPVSCPTSVCFGGPDLRTMYVTSSYRYLDEDELVAQPFAGGVITFEPGVTGLPIHRVRL